MSTSATVQAEVDRQNSTFWNELCGSSLAKRLGVVDFSKSSLERFDRHYMRLYPYLDRYVRPEALRGRDVLEVGLGYGTMSQRIAEAGARYAGLDIAQGPVEVVNRRLSMNGLPGRARVGSILDAPFAAESFDAAVAIGCLHHTGNLARAIQEILRVLRPGGRAVIMVYNGLSYRRWLRWPIKTWTLWRGGAVARASDAERKAYDPGENGGAPETVFPTAEELRGLCGGFSRCVLTKENAATRDFLYLLPRSALLRTIGPVCGLDLYGELTK